jgi:hypothetical protein
MLGGGRNWDGLIYQPAEKVSRVFRLVLMRFRLSAKLCALGVSAVANLFYTFTAETQRARR